MYDNHGKRTRSLGHDGSTVDYHYDAHHQLTAIQVKHTDGSTTGYHYDPQGRLSSIIRPTGQQHFTYDGAGRLTDGEDPSGHTRHFAYDQAGRLTALHNENGAITRFEYDEMDRLIRETGFDGRIKHFQYDLAGQLIALTEESLEGTPTTRYDYDVVGRLIARHLPATAHIVAISEHFRWRKDGKLVGADTLSADICGSRVDFTYDLAGRLSSETQQQQQPGGPLWRWSHCHDYKAHGVRERSTYGELPPIPWLTYGSGHLHGVRLPNLDIDFERDALHREIERNIRTPDTPLLLSTDREYTAQGQLAASHVQIGARSASRTYAYDALGRLTHIDDSAHPEASLRYTYDASGRLTASQHGSTPFHYAFDPAGNRIDPNPARPDSPQENWRETVRKNLHDPNFNVLAHLGPDSASTASFLWPDNRITELGEGRNTYDGAGNLIEHLKTDGTRFKLYYDGAHRFTYLIRTNPDGSTVESFYQYDALSRRIRKGIDHPNGKSIRIRYGWEGERLAYADDGAHNTTILYEPGSFVPMARIDRAAKSQAEQALAAPYEALKAQFVAANLPLPAQLHLDPGPMQVMVFINDPLGTPQKLVDHTGSIVWEAEADDWAAVKNETGIHQPIRFQGQWEDEESGFYYNRYRYYDPAIGRYISQDPIGLTGGLHAYQYASANPVGSYDPLGLWDRFVQAFDWPGSSAPPANPAMPCVGEGIALAKKLLCDSGSAREAADKAMLMRIERQWEARDPEGKILRDAENYLTSYLMVSEGKEKWHGGIGAAVANAYITPAWQSLRALQNIFGFQKHSPASFDALVAGYQGAYDAELKSICGK